MRTVWLWFAVVASAVPCGIGDAFAEDEATPAPVEARARDLAERAGLLREDLKALETRISALEAWADREEKDEATPRRPRPRPAEPKPETPPPEGAPKEEGPAEEGAGPPDAETEKPAPAEDEESVDPAILEVAGTYELDVEAFQEAVQTAMREQLARDVGEVPSELLDQILEGLMEQLRGLDFRFVLSVEGTFEASATIGGEAKEASGTWTREGDTVTLRTTREDGEDLDEPEEREATWEDGVLTIQPSDDDDMPFPVVLRKVA